MKELTQNEEDSKKFIYFYLRWLIEYQVKCSQVQSIGYTAKNVRGGPLTAKVPSDFYTLSFN
jgi:hypothetical protein